MYKLAVVLALVSCAHVSHSQIRGTPWKNCVRGSNNLVINNVEVEGCTAAPCVLTRGTIVSVTITFTPERQISDLTNKLYGLLLRVTCPMSPGTQYVQVVSLFIPLDWPLMHASIQWKMVDESAPNVGCFEIPDMIAQT
ncbi:hypothetical protein EMCRGX_G001011 [Ephydatia muelleri]